MLVDINIGIDIYFTSLTKAGPTYPLPGEEFSFEVRVEVEQRRVLRAIQRLLLDYKNAHKGPTVILVETKIGKTRQGRVLH